MWATYTLMQWSGNDPLHLLAILVASAIGLRCFATFFEWLRHTADVGAGSPRLRALDVLAQCEDDVGRDPRGQSRRVHRR